MEALAAAARRAGLSCSRSPFLNQWMATPCVRAALSEAMAGSTGGRLPFYRLLFLALALAQTLSENI